MSSAKWRPFCLGLNVLSNKLHRAVFLTIWRGPNCCLRSSAWTGVVTIPLHFQTEGYDHRGVEIFYDRKIWLHECFVGTGVHPVWFMLWSNGRAINSRCNIFWDEHICYQTAKIWKSLAVFKKTVPNSSQFKERTSKWSRPVVCHCQSCVLCNAHDIWQTMF